MCICNTKLMRSQDFVMSRWGASPKYDSVTFWHAQEDYPAPSIEIIDRTI